MSRASNRLLAAAPVNATLVRAGVTRLIGYNIIIASASVRYVKLYDKATAPANTDTPFLTIMIPANSDRVFDFDGAGLRCNLGLGFRIVAALVDNDNTAVAASDVLCQLLWEAAS